MGETTVNQVAPGYASKAASRGDSHDLHLLLPASPCSIIELVVLGRQVIDNILEKTSGPSNGVESVR